MLGRRLVWLLPSLVLAPLAGCPGPALPTATPRHGPGEPQVGPTAGSPRSWGNTLRQEVLAEVLVDFVQGRAIPSNFSSLSQGPELALGSVYVIKARAGKDCSSTNPADYEDGRLPDYRLRTAACVVKIFPKASRKEQTVKGSVRGGLQFVLGGGQVNAESVYQLTFEDTQAVFESTSDCIDLDRLAHAALPARTCAAKYISGAVLTTITWRDYQKADASVNGTYTSLVKVGVDLYGSTSGMTMTPVLSFDAIDLDGFRMVTADGKGFLQIVPPTKGVADAEDFKATIEALAEDKNETPPDRWNTLFATGLGDR